MKLNLQKALVVTLALMIFCCSDDCEEQVGSLTAPELVSPANQVTLPVTNVTFEWIAVKNAEEYELQLAVDPSFTNIFESRTEITTTSVDKEGLAFETTYFWRVRAYRNQLISDWSTVSRFTIAPIPAPIPLSPAPNSVLTTRQASLEWSLVDQAASYTVQVSTDENFLSGVVEESSIPGTSTVMDELSWFDEHFWRVRAENGGQVSPWSEVQSFGTLHPVPENDLIAHYPFNGTADDATTNQFHGNVSGAQLSTDRFGSENSAYLFDGIDDFIHITHDDALNLIGDFTISVWVNSDGCDVVCDPPGYHTIIMKREAHVQPDNWPWGLAISYINNAPGPFLKTVVGSIRTDGILEYKWSDRTITLNNWHHVVLKMENNVQSIYIDAELAGSAELFQAQHPNEKPVIIGSALRGDGAEYFKGKIDDIRIYSRALNEDETRGLFYE